MDQSWDEWIQSKECFDFLFSYCAPAVLRQAQHLALSREVWPYHGENLTPETKTELLQDLVGEMWKLLKENKNLPVEQLLTYVQNQNWHGLKLILVRLFIQDYVEKRRNSSPWYKLYKYVRQIIAGLPEFVYLAESNKSFYAACQDKDLSKSPPEFWLNQDYNLWPDPPFSVHDFNQKKFIQKTAIFFWEQACQKLNQKCLLPIRELVAFIWAKFNYFYQLEETREAELSSEPERGSIDREESQDLLLDRQLLQSQLSTLAQQLTSSWSDKMCVVFYLKHEQELSLGEIAHQLHYKSASSVKYVLQQTYDSLRFFCSLWPGLSPPDLDQVLFDLFLENIIYFCKTKYSVHNKQ